MKLLLSIFILLLLNICWFAHGNPDENIEVETKTVPGSLIYKSDPNTRERNITSEKATFKKFVLFRHSERLEAVKNILKLNDYAKQYEMLDIVFKKMFEIMLEDRLILESSGYIPGEDWPLNMSVRDAMARTIENTLFFGELILRLPDISHKVLKSNKEWKLLVTWSWSFSQQCLPFLHEKLHAPLNLMAQELEIVEKDPAFYNQFKLEHQKLIKELPKEAKPHEKKKKRNKPKGPMMSSSLAGEL